MRRYASELEQGRGPTLRLHVTLPISRSGWRRTLAPHNVEYQYREIIVPASLTDTFAFFADAANLPRITPPWLHFSIRTSMPVQMRAGLEIAYRISLYGLPIPWQSRIDVWEPGVCFVDRQIVGPYCWWRHEHRFEVVRGGTRVIDHVDYAPRVGWFSGALVRRDLRRIFAYRHEVAAAAISGVVPHKQRLLRGPAAPPHRRQRRPLGRELNKSDARIPQLLPLSPVVGFSR